VYFKGAGLAVVEVRWRDPFGVAVGAFSGGPAAGFDQPMMGSAGEGEVVHARGPTCRELVDVVDFAEVAGHVAAGRCTATVLRVQHNSLSRRSQSFGVIQPDDRAFVEDRQVVMGVTGQPDDVGHGQHGAPAGECLAAR
jgi:hypothetical protein